LSFVRPVIGHRPLVLGLKNRRVLGDTTLARASKGLNPRNVLAIWWSVESVSGRITTAAKPILEVNPHHQLIVSLASLGEDEKGFKDDAAHLLARRGAGPRW
jgi:hypothetical protein